MRIDTQQADALLACDLVVGASPDALATVRHGRTRILANTHEVPVAESLRNPDASLKVPQLLEKLRFAAGADRVETLDAQALAEAFLGDSIFSNIVALGYAWQRGLVPVSLEALLRAIELNGVAVENNKLAFSLGRLAAADPRRWRAPAARRRAAARRRPRRWTRWSRAASRTSPPTRTRAYARRYADVRRNACARARPRCGADAGLPFTRAVAQQPAEADGLQGRIRGGAPVHRRRVHAQRCAQQFEGDVAAGVLHGAAAAQPRQATASRRARCRLGGWMLPAMKLLAQGRRLRGTALDVFGRTTERRMERELIAQYARASTALLPALDARHA